MKVPFLRLVKRGLMDLLYLVQVYLLANVWVTLLLDVLRSGSNDDAGVAAPDLGR